MAKVRDPTHSQYTCFAVRFGRRMGTALRGVLCQPQEGCPSVRLGVRLFMVLLDIVGVFLVYFDLRLTCYIHFLYLASYNEIRKVTWCIGGTAVFVGLSSREDAQAFGSRTLQQPSYRKTSSMFTVSSKRVRAGHLSSIH